MPPDIAPTPTAGRTVATWGRALAKVGLAAGAIVGASLSPCIALADEAASAATASTSDAHSVVSRDNDQPKPFVDASGAPITVLEPLPGIASPPPPYRAETRALSAVWGAGTAFAGIGYALSLVGAITTSDGSHYQWPFLPLAGPWVALGFQDVNQNPVAVSFLTVCGAIQAAGLGMIVAGSAMRERVFVWRPRTPRDVEATVFLSPGGTGIRMTF